MNLKELAKKENRFVSGHRACAGCGFPQIIRTALASTDKKIVVTNATGCLEVVSTIYPFSSWKTPYIHSAFENAGATISGIESAYKILKKKGKIKEDIKFLAIGGDGATSDIGIGSLSGAFERGHDFVYLMYDNEAYQNCLTLDSLILTENGLKLITEVKKGEKIYTFGQNDYNLVLKKCDGIFDNGKKRIFELSTLHHNIKATGNHPFLVLKHNGRANINEFIWKNLEKIKKGDEIVVQKNMNEGKPYYFTPIKISKKGDYKVNKIHEVSIPKLSNKNLMKLLGIWVGDGWVRLDKTEVGFAIPKNDKARKILLNLIKQIFKTYPAESKNEVHIRSINICRFIESLGFGRGSKNKTIPSWVFTITKKEKEAFLEGLMLSDGYKFGDSWRYTSSSYDLIKRLRLFLQTMNYRVGKIYHEKVKKGKWVVYRKLLKDTENWRICFSKIGKWNIKKYKTQYEYQNFLIKNKYFNTEKVINIRKLDIEPTLDLRIEGEHNFIANGIVVHNTGVQMSGATPKYANTTTTPIGKIHRGNEFYRKDIIKIALAHNIPYIAQASVGDLVDLSNKMQKAFETKGPCFVSVLQPCVPGWKIDPSQTIKIARLAYETGAWPLFEIENGNLKLNYAPEKLKPVKEYLALQGRFKHLTMNEIEDIQRIINENWELLKNGEFLDIRKLF